MTVDFGILPVISALAALLFVIYYLLYRRFIYSVVDPLFVWVFTTAFASVLATQIVPDTEGIIHFFGCQACLWVGFVFAYRHYDYKIGHDLIETKSTFQGQLLLRWVTYLLLIVYVFTNMIIGYVKGFSLLTDAPTEAKIANFQQGFGLFRKLNWSTGNFVGTALFFMFFVEKRKIDLVSLAVVIIFTALEGSKSSLLQIAVSAGIIIYHPAFAKQRLRFRKYRWFMPIGLLGILSTTFVVLIKENGGTTEAFLAFIRRLLYSADSLIFYYHPANDGLFDNYSFGDYIARITNPILGFFRLQPYIEAPGNLMVDNQRTPGSIAGVTVGPNAPFYIESRIYFNYWAAFPYSVIVGYLYARARTYYFSLKKASAFYFVFIGSWLHFASAIIIDMNLAVTLSFDLFFFVLLPYIFISLLLTKRLKIRLNFNFAEAYRRALRAR